MIRRAALALLLAARAAGAAAQELADPRASQIDALFAEHNRLPSPGLAIGVVRDGQVLLRKGYGLANIEHRVPITSATVFDVASVSKQFAGLAVAMLVSSGKIKLSDDIRTYIPEVAALNTPITVAHLVHHTSGLRDWPGTLSVAGWRFDDVISFEQILNLAYGQRTLNFVPGAEHLYSNTGYNLLAELVKRVTGQSFREWTDEQIFTPLGMTNSHFRDDHTVVIPNRAFGYTRSAAGSYRHTPNNLTALGSSSLFSTVDDLTRWLINFDTWQVGGRDAIALMRTRGALNDGTAVPYAFGIVHGNYRGLPTLAHSGSWASFRSDLIYFPEQKFGIVALANGSSVNAQDAVMKIANIYLEQELGPAVTPPSLATGPVVPVPESLLDEYVGLYRLGPGWYLRITRAGAALSAQATREGVVSMSPRSEREFWVQDYGASVVFQRDSAGKVARLVYRGMRAPRVEDSGSAQMPALAEYIGTYESAELRTGYTVALRGGALHLEHQRHGIIPLGWILGEEFGSGVWFLRSIEFRRDRAGRVTEMVVNGDSRSRDIRFVKRS